MNKLNLIKLNEKLAGNYQYSDNIENEENNYFQNYYQNNTLTGPQTK